MIDDGLGEESPNKLSQVNQMVEIGGVTLSHQSEFSFSPIVSASSRTLSNSAFFGGPLTSTTPSTSIFVPSRMPWSAFTAPPDHPYEVSTAAYLAGALSVLTNMGEYAA